MYSASTFKNKTILITGASSGIGKKTAILLSNLGARCILSGRNLTKLNKTKELLKNDNHIILPADLSEEKDILALAGKTPCIDGFVNCAGIIQPYLIKYLKNKSLDNIWSVNLKAPILLTSFLLKEKKINAGCSIIFISSIVTQAPYIGAASYASSKAAIEAFSKTLALEHSAQKIRSNVISPGMVKTPIYQQAENLISDANKATYMKRYLLGEIEDSDVSNLIIFLLSDLSSKMTGNVINIDSGFLLSIH